MFQSSVIHTRTTRTLNYHIKESKCGHTQERLHFLHQKSSRKRAMSNEKIELNKN